MFLGHYIIREILDVVRSGTVWWCQASKGTECRHLFLVISNRCFKINRILFQFSYSNWLMFGPYPAQIFAQSVIAVRRHIITNIAKTVPTTRGKCCFCIKYKQNNTCLALVMVGTYNEFNSIR